MIRCSWDEVLGYRNKKGELCLTGESSWLSKRQEVGHWKAV